MISNNWTVLKVPLTLAADAQLSLREHIADNAKEKEYINSLISDLSNDIKVIDGQMPAFETSLSQLDTVGLIF
jgi:hypothetical protein